MWCPKCEAKMDLTCPTTKKKWKCPKCKQVFVEEEFKKDSFMPYDHYNLRTHKKLKQVNK